MERLKKKKFLVLFLIAVVFLLAERENLDVALSEWVSPRAGGQVYSNMAEGTEAVGGLVGGDILRQRLYLGEGALAVGVRIGTYQRTNDSHYVLKVYDSDGNILGKREVSALGLDDNEMCYVDVYARISQRQDYYLVVEGVDAVPENTVTCYGVPAADGHENAALNGAETGMELVTEVLYRRVFPVAECAAGVTTTLLFVYFFYGELKWFLCSLVGLLAGMAKRHYRKLLLSCVAVGTVGALVLLLFPKKEWNVIRGNLQDESHETARYYTEKWSQIFTAAEDFDAVGVKLGTYKTPYQRGWIYLTLYDAENGVVMGEDRIAAKKVEDNQFLRFDTGKLEQGKAYRMELWTEDFDGQPLALYCTEDGNSLIFHLLQKGREHSVAGILAFVLLAVVSGVWWLCLSADISKGKKELLVTALASVAVGILANTYGNYRSLSLEAVAKNLGLSGRGEILEISREEIEENTERTGRYDAHGGLYRIQDQIKYDVYGQIDTITFYFAEGENRPVKNDISLFWDKGNGFSVKPDFYQEYDYKGQKSICIPVKEFKKVNTMLFSSTFGEEFSGVVTLEDHWYRFEKIVLNEKTICLNPLNWTFLVGFLFVWLVYGWQLVKAEQHLAEWEKGKNVEVGLFVILALIFGVSMSLLLPARMVMDEPYHISHTLESIGVEEENISYIISYINNAISGIKHNGGITVDLDQYCENLGRYLPEYPSSFSFNMEVLRYPGASLGTMLGLILRLPIGWILFLGEFFSLLVYIGVGALAIWLVPIRKKLFLVLLLLPLPMQQAASYSHDSFNNALSILMIAYCIRLAYREAKLKAADIIALAVMSFLLLYIKKAYVMLSLFALLCLYQRITSSVNRLWNLLKSRKKKIVVAVGSIVLVSLMAIVMLSVVDKVVGLEDRILGLIQLLGYPKELLLYLGQTLIQQIPFWGELRFAWYDTTRAGWIEWTVLLELVIAALYIGDRNCNWVKWNWSYYFKCIAVFLLTALLVIYSMIWHVQWIRPVTGGVYNQLLLHEIIEGVQNRYFIPIAALLFLFPVTKEMKVFLDKLPMRLLLCSGWIAITAFTVTTLLNRFWI